jgi:hypothetical protein
MRQYSRIFWFLLFCLESFPNKAEDQFVPLRVHTRPDERVIDRVGGYWRDGDDSAQQSHGGYQIRHLFLGHVFA